MLDKPILFEFVLRRFLGEKAHYTASSENFDRSRNQWLRKVAKKMSIEINSIDTHDDHKEQLHFFTDKFRSALGTKSPDERVLIYSLLGLVASLLGFYSTRGAKLASLSYSRTAEEYYAALLLKGGDALEAYYDGSNVVNIRWQVVADLKAKGVDDFHIAMALNTSESAVKRLKK